MTRRLDASAAPVAAMSATPARAILAPDWVTALRRYVVALALGSLVWEMLHLPLYTIWETGTFREKAFAVVHCTGGDVLIGVSTLLLALCLAGDRRWPTARFWPVALLTVAFGASYTIFSEWLNIVVRAAWAYSDAMPVLPWLGTGLSPLLQWIAVPLAALALARGGLRPFSTHMEATS